VDYEVANNEDIEITNDTANQVNTRDQQDQNEEHLPIFLNQYIVDNEFGQIGNCTRHTGQVYTKKHGQGGPPQVGPKVRKQFH
jgi:hypothetical protein